MEKILGFNICTLNKEKLLENIEKDIINKRNNIIYNINPLIMVNFYNNKNIIKEISKEKYNIPDGIGVVYASKIHHGLIKERITGIDLFLSLCEMASRLDKKIFLYGSREGVAEKTKKVLENKYPNINICGYINGYSNESLVLSEIKKCKPDILFVALGSPKQEDFIIRNKECLKDINLVMPIGGSMDVISGNLRAAPSIYKKLHLEWLYRLIQEPKRIKEDIKLFKFILLVIFRNNWYNEK